MATRDPLSGYWYILADVTAEKISFLPKVTTPGTAVVIADKLPALPHPTRMMVHEGSEGPTSKFARFTCDKCKGTTFVQLPWGATATERSTTVKKALDEHRVICPKGLPEDMRVYAIEYPR